MSTAVRRRLRGAAAASLLVLVPVLGACGFNAQTDQVYQPAVGVNDHDGQVDVLNAVVVSGTDGSGTFVASLSNKSTTEDDTLTGISASDGTTVSLAKSIEIPAGQLVNTADLGAASVSGDTVKEGAFLRLTLTFESGQTSELNVPVVPRERQFSDVAPALPSASPSS